MFEGRVRGKIFAF